MSREMEAAGHDVAALSGEPSGVVRIATECYTCYHWLPATLREFGATHPTVETRIVVEATRRPVRALLRRRPGRRDRQRGGSATGASRSSRSSGMSSVAVKRLDHPLAKKPFLEARDFARENFLTYSASARASSMSSVCASAGGCRATPLDFVELTEAMIEMAGRDW